MEGPRKDGGGGVQGPVTTSGKEGGPPQRQVGPSLSITTVSNLVPLSSPGSDTRGPVLPASPQPCVAPTRPCREGRAPGRCQDFVCSREDEELGRGEAM